MKTYWYHHPETIDRLAAEYCLGTLHGAARRRFDMLLQSRPDLHRAVWAWHDRLAGLLLAEKPMAVPAGQWDRLEARLFAKPGAAQGSKSPWWRRWFAPIPAGALALGLLLGTVIVPLWQALYGGASQTQLPESYVGVLATADGQPGLIVSSLRKGKTVDLKQLAAVAVAPQQSLYLWSIDKNGKVQGIGPIPGGKFASAALPQVAEQLFFAAVELAVSVEPQGQNPSQPSGAFVYRGLCGKLWKLPGT
ncbi:MAG: anti-sigma factor [Rhodoferax sp.]|nr:anti-sigma factor [Rhodoferax sp.]